MSNSVNRPAKRFNKIQIAIDSVTRFFSDYAEKKRFAYRRTADLCSIGCMLTSDEFSTYVANLLSGTYDCVDRISVRGYFPLGQTSGGL